MFSNPTNIQQLSITTNVVLHMKHSMRKQGLNFIDLYLKSGEQLISLFCDLPNTNKFCFLCEALANLIPIGVLTLSFSEESCNLQIFIDADTQDGLQKPSNIYCSPVNFNWKSEFLNLKALKNSY